jgi:hypothetical protein
VTAALAVVRRAADRVWTPWRDFWFKPADPLPLAVMRILFGLMLFYTHLVWGMNLEGFFGPNGWQGDTLVHTFQQGSYAWSFWWHVPGALHLAVHILCLVVLALFTFGVCTPLTSILAYLITVSYAYRAPLANYGLDQINAIAALYLAIGPSGATLSIDRLWRRKRNARIALATGKTAAEEPVVPSARANLTLRLMQVHVCVIYIFACQSKLQGESWWNGQAIWQAVSNLEYQSTDLTWLAWYPWLVNILTHGTVLFEMTFWALVWRPLCRPIVLLIGVAIHLGIGAFMGMWTFGLAMVFLYVAFVPATTIHSLLRTLSRLVGRRVRQDESPSELASADLEASELEASDDELSIAALSIAATVSDSPFGRALAAPSFKLPDDPSPQLPLTAAPANRIDSAHPNLGRRPALVVVESRLKRQTQIQEYLVRRGFRCFVASDLHQARSLLCVVDIDAIVVTSTWFSDEDIAAFRDALITGGPSLPASLFFMTGAHHSLAVTMTETARHRLVRTVLSLRELRLMILEILSPAQRVAYVARHASASPNGNGHGKKHTEQERAVEQRKKSDPLKREPSSIGDGDQT